MSVTCVVRLSSKRLAILRAAQGIMCLCVAMSSGQVAAQSVADVIKSESNWSIFSNALEHAGLMKALDVSDAVTVFVPSDVAMENEGSTFLLDKVLTTPDNQERLLDLLTYHIIPETNKDFSEPGGLFELSTQSNECLPVSRSGNTLEVGPEAVVTGTYIGGNGTIYVVDRMLWAPYEGSHCDFAVQDASSTDSDLFGWSVADDKSLTESIDQLSRHLQAKYVQDDLLVSLDETPGLDFVAVANDAVKSPAHVPALGMQTAFGGQLIRDDTSLNTALLHFNEEVLIRGEDLFIRIARSVVNRNSFERYALALSLSAHL